MPSIGIPQIIAVSSAVLGLITLITSALLLDTYSSAYDICEVEVLAPIFKELCEDLRYVLAAGSIGIIASVIQMGAVSVGYMRKWRLWCILQLVVALCSLVAFSIAIDKKVHEHKGGDADSRGKAFCAFAGIDLFFAILAAAGVFYLTKE